MNNDCSKCIHTYETKCILNTPKEWDKVLRSKKYRGVKKIKFKYKSYILYLREFRRHNCQAGSWSHVTISDNKKMFGYEERNINYIKKQLERNGWDGLSGVWDNAAEISVYSDDDNLDFKGFAGAKRIERKGTLLIIHIEEL